MLNNARYILAFLITLLVLATCSTKKDGYVSKPVRSAANSDDELLQTEVTALHENDTVSTLFVQIENENLLYRRNDTGTTFYARVNLRVLVYLEGNEKKIVDSSLTRISDISAVEKVVSKKLQVAIPCRSPRGVYTAALEFYDLNRHVRYFETYRIDHRNATNPQNFLVLERDSVAFRPYFFSNETLRVRSPMTNNGQLYVDVYNYDFGPAPPPFSTKEQYEEAPRPDSTYEVAVTNSMAIIQMPRRGALVLKGSNSSSQGLCLFVADDAFPGVSNSLEMIQCTRYIMSKEEFDACVSADDQKVAIDNFWLGIGGNKDRARELVRRYYGRVKDANKLYSSFLPGWKTDRGMIYIVLGPPFAKYADKGGEVWVYGNEANPNSLRFVFKPRKNALTENDFVLERSIFYRDPFHNAVEFWRQGVVFNEFRR